MSLFSAFAKDLFEFANVTGKIVGNVAHGKLDSLGSPAGRGAEGDFGAEAFFGDEDLESTAQNSEASTDVLLEIQRRRSTFADPISKEESENGEALAAWREKYGFQIFTADRSRLSNLLNQSAVVRQYYDELCREAITSGEAQEHQPQEGEVPANAGTDDKRIAEREFFTRYFYRMYRGRCESAVENRKRAQEAAALEEGNKKQKGSTAQSTSRVPEDDDPWGDFDAPTASTAPSAGAGAGGGTSQLQIRDLNRRLEKTVESLTEQVQRLTAENKQLRERIALLEAAAAAGAITAVVATAGSTQSMPSSSGSSSSSAVVVNSADSQDRSPTTKGEPQKASQDDDYADWADTA